MPFVYLPIYRAIRCVFFGKTLLREKIYTFFFFICTFREIVLLSRENRGYICIYLRCVELNVSQIVDFRRFLSRGAAQSRAKSFSANGPLLDRFVIPRQDRFLLLSARDSLIPHFTERNYSCNSSSPSRSPPLIPTLTYVYFTFFLFIYLIRLPLLI